MIRNNKSAAIILALISTLFLNVLYSQHYPGFTPGNPVNHLQTVRFYDIDGTQVGSCNCQLVGGGFKCGDCLPSSFVTYTYESGSGTVECVNAAVLPVELLSFKASVTGNTVKLQWVTQSERYNDRFILERSENGTTFAVVAEIPGAGSSNELLAYAWEDVLSSEGLVYYRLLQVDSDGTEKILDLLSVKYLVSSDRLFLYPNPSAGTVNIVLPAYEYREEFSVCVSDAAGKLLHEYTAESNVPLQLEPGMYLVTLMSSAGAVMTERLIVR